MIISIAAVIAFLLLSAFFSGSETALTGASQAFMLDQEKNEHNPKAKTINRLFKHRDKLIITTLLGSNLFNTMATSLATSVLISLFGSEGVAYATVIMTVLVLIYTDMLPKSYSVKHANAVALVVAPMVNFWVAVFSPLTYVLQKIVNLTFRLFKLQSSGENSEDAAISEIRGAIDMYKGEEIKEESEMLKSILDLDDVEVYDVMNHRRNLFALNIDMPVKKMVDKVKNSPFSRIPLYQDKPENIVGVIRVKHLLKECVDKKNDFSKIDVRKLMSAPWFIPENTTLLQQLQMFRKRREHFAIMSTNTAPCKALSRWKTSLKKSSVTSTTKPTFRISIPWAFAKTAKTAGWLTDRFPSATSTANSVGTSTMNAPLPLPAICWK